MEGLEVQPADLPGKVTVPARRWCYDPREDADAAEKPVLHGRKLLLLISCSQGFGVGRFGCPEPSPASGPQSCDGHPRPQYAASSRRFRRAGPGCGGGVQRCLVVRVGTREPGPGARVHEMPRV